MVSVVVLPTVRPKDLSSALPSQTTSKARLPKRLIQAKLAMQHVSRDSANNRKHDVKCSTGGGCNLGPVKEVAAARESPYPTPPVSGQRLSRD
ncbi:hypothetical protein L1987_32615 [Smallanthus sonchifolius]|uniref:Uncharacterized protein n=1 Tax=Smallanthus sonchifolius TaxID=185202 RepID=A0ACB9HNR4_9ASTR|nr:hypothetical protein L1987_32615 [Smallanthus sonchifolius]